MNSNICNAEPSSISDPSILYFAAIWRSSISRYCISIVTNFASSSDSISSFSYTSCRIGSIILIEPFVSLCASVFWCRSSTRTNISRFNRSVTFTSIPTICVSIVSLLRSCSKSITSCGYSLRFRGVRIISILAFSSSVFWSGATSNSNISWFNCRATTISPVTT